jgi:TRAP-type C4-dicarboxylate transport system permease small subunit
MNITNLIIGMFFLAFAFWNHKIKGYTYWTEEDNKNAIASGSSDDIISALKFSYKMRRFIDIIWSILFLISGIMGIYFAYKNATGLDIVKEGFLKLISKI